jgi:hypothetical protein
MLPMVDVTVTRPTWQLDSRGFTFKLLTLTIWTMCHNSLSFLKSRALHALFVRFLELQVSATHPQLVSAIARWTGIIAAVSFVIRATVHTTLKAKPMQLVFCRDAILKTRVGDSPHAFVQVVVQIQSCDNSSGDSVLSKSLVLTASSIKME